MNNLRGLWLFSNVMLSAGTLFFLAVGFYEPFSKLVVIFNDDTVKPLSAWLKFAFSSISVGALWAAAWLWFKGSEKKFLDHWSSNT